MQQSDLVSDCPESSDGSQTLMNLNIKVAGVQCDISLGKPAENLAMMRDYLQQLADQPLFLVAFPECFLQGYCFETIEEAREQAVTLESADLNAVQALAAEFDRHIVFGFLQRIGDEIFNACGLATRQGELHVYHKVHLPKLGVDQFTTPGQSLNPVIVDGISIGLNICYDCSFPEPARLLALRNADLIVLPTNWPPGAGRTADYIPNARAMENNIYFMAINRVGNERGFAFIGKSKICDPDGNDLVFADHDQPEILMADIDIARARNKHLIRVPDKHEIHRFADRRPEIYSDLSEPMKMERR